MFKPQAIFLMGPTASGKSSLAIELHDHLPIGIISVDSAQIYRGMDVGTAKPTSSQIAKIPHYLINICDPKDFYSVANFCCDVIKEMKKITKSGRIPLLVGGTMFYFKSLLEGLSLLPSTDLEVRTYIKHQAEKIGWNSLYKQLQQIDPIAAKNIHPNDHQRLSRALEIFLISGKTKTELMKKNSYILEYKIHQFIITPINRILMHNRITQRFYQILTSGFEDEVKVLFRRGDLNKEMQSIKCIGYRQMWSYLSGNIKYDEMVFRSIFATKNLAKHQITWLKNWSNAYWLDSDKPIIALNFIKKMFYSIIK